MRNKQYNRAVQSLHLVMREHKMTRAEQERSSGISAAGLARTESLLPIEPT